MIWRYRDVIVCIVKNVLQYRLFFLYGKGDTMKILEARNLRKIYGKGEAEVRALDGVSLFVEKGENC